MFYSADYCSIPYQSDDGNKLPSKLPQWLDLPKGLNRNKNSTIPGDFLMLAEGSEVEGPIPRLVIPKQGNGDFNLDNFSVCLMSTDMQTQNGLLNFCMRGDAQLLMSQNDWGLFSFVQHFTLHDTMARGFVRPFCLAYLSQDRNKLIHFQDRLSYEFSRVVSHYKVGNFLMFFRDMLHTLSDLQYTREKHLESMETGVPLVYDNDDDIAYTQTVQSFIGTDDLPSNCSYKPQESSSIEGETTMSFKDFPLAPEVVSSTKTKRSGDGILDKKESGELPFHISNKQPQAHLPEMPDCILPKANGLQKELSDRNSLNSTPSKIVKDPRVQLKEFDDAIKEVREILTMVSNLLEKHHVEVREQFSPKADEKLGETPLDSKNFNMAQHLQHTSQTKHGDPANIEPSWIKWTYAEDSYKPKFRKSLRVKIQKKLRSFELLTEPTFDGYGLLHSLYRYFDRTHLTLAMELDDIKDLDPPEGLLTIGRVVYLNFLANFEKSSSACHESDGIKDSNEDVNSGTPVNVLVKEWMSEKTVIGFHACSSYGTSDAEVGHLYKSMEKEEQGQESTTIKNEIKNPPIISKPQDQSSEQVFPNRPTCLDLSLTDVDEKTSETCNKKVQPAEKASVVSFADHISSFSSSKRIGSGILKLFRTHPSQAVDMIYSLLIGRTLIIYTSVRTNEVEVRDIVTALWLFVPGHFSVLPWATKSISTQDLVRLKLVGMLKGEEHFVPLHSHNSVSIFDVNKKKFLGPSYKSGILFEVASKRTIYSDESSFVAYLHSVLFHLANKSFLYFHGFCMSEGNNDKESSQNLSSSWSKRNRKFEDFVAFSKSFLKVSDNDACIVMYLSKVVKDQLRGRMIPVEDGIQLSLNQIPYWPTKAQPAL